MIYLDHAAATPVSPRVREAMEPYFADLFFNPSAAYLPAKRVREDYEAAKGKIANFIGAKGNVYQVMIPFAKKDFSYVRLNQQARRETISKILSAVSGKQMVFEAVLESDVGDRKMDSVRNEAQQSLIDTFGRENVQIDEGKEQ